MVDKTFTADAILKGTYTKTFTADAILYISEKITLGALTLTVDWDEIRPKYEKKTAKHTILGATNSKRQYIGRDSHQYDIQGIFSGTNKDTDMETLRNYYLNNTEIAFQGYTSLSVQVRIIDLEERDYYTYWEYKLTIEETGGV